MNTITLLRSKGLTDDEIMVVISQRHASATADAYAKGYTDGKKQVLKIVEGCVEFIRYGIQTNMELAC